ncbi:MAG: threonine--tRNA ligase [Gammaproteobacteria bacterium]|nr:MAG: threonine--tRNA ligase [Gammaproteobacteria bacterium]
MPIITLPDGSQKHFEKPVTVAEVAADIGPGLARAALAGRIGDRLVDTSFTLSEDAQLSIVTGRDEDGLEVIRHSTAHLLAQAVKQLFPNAQVTIGPVVENGFYYDFAFERAFTPEDLEAIEQRMAALVKQNIKIERSVMNRKEAVEFFRNMGEEYKAEIIDSIPQADEITLYRQGDFTDLCRGPHVPSTEKLGAFKLTKLAGAYWRGDPKNPMLQRIYGTAWPDKKALKAYLYRLEEAEKRDHRQLGRRQNLFHFQEEAPGMVFWHAKGWTLYRIIEGYIRTLLGNYGYEEVHTPQILDRTLWERSGHWDKFRDMIFTTQAEHKDYAIKPMNCPAHVQIFNQGLKSYRDLPLRIAEFGIVHRNEPSGTLHGLLRARRFTQDDAHIFCTEDQLQVEVAALIELTFQVYRDFGFTEIDIALSTRPEQRVGTDEQWDRAEHSLERALNDQGLTWKLQLGEGAFYGPKIDFVLKDSIGRLWQCGTIQVDFSMPERLGAHYIAENSTKQVPVMIHRAILGSLERFIGMLIEHHAGSLPAWLAPVQAVVANITDRQADYAKKVAETLKNKGLRVEMDLRNEKIGYKIREHSMQRVPYLLVVGDREAKGESVAVRARNGEDLGTMSIEAFADHLKTDIVSRGHVVLEG